MPRPQPSRLGSRALSYSVIRIVAHNGAVIYEVVDTPQVRDREEVYNQAYLNAAREWKPTTTAGMLTQPQKPQVRIWRNVMAGPGAVERAKDIAEQCRKQELKRDEPDSATPTTEDSGKVPKKDPKKDSDTKLPSLKK